MSDSARGVKLDVLPANRSAMATSPELTVILAEAPGNPDVLPALRAIDAACAGMAVEIVIVRPVGRAPAPSDLTLPIRELPSPKDALVPERWGQAVSSTSAPYFACLTTELLVHSLWASTLLDALRSGAAGAAGTIAISPEAGATASAIYLIRFSAFISPPTPVEASGQRIPGDSAGYSAAAVKAYPDLLDRGFWEAEFHRRLVAQGRYLHAITMPLTTFDTRVNLPMACAVRFRHARDFGATRVRDHHATPWRLALVAPIVPFILLFRTIRRALVLPGGVRLALKATPALFLLCVAWASGEAAGAWSARHRS